MLGYDKLALKSELPTDYLSSSLKGVANGLAELDATGKIPSSQLPSYVDDVIEGYFISDTEFNDMNDNFVTIEAGKIYADVDTNYIYRWSGTKLTRITGNLVAEARQYILGGDILVSVDPIKACIVAEIERHRFSFGSE